MITVLNNGIVIQQRDNLWYAHDPQTSSYTFASTLHTILKVRVDQLLTKRNTQLQIESPTYPITYRKAMR